MMVVFRVSNPGTRPIPNGNVLTVQLSVFPTQEKDNKRNKENKRTENKRKRKITKESKEKQTTSKKRAKSPDSNSQISNLT